MNDQINIAILLATFNGEEYIEPQINSIIGQTYKGWNLYICDDGSNDGTPGIIEKYVQQYSNIHQIKSKVTTQGAKRNFLNMLETVDADYYMFADQDDVWLKDKIELSLKKIQEQEKKTPSLPIVVHTDLIVVNESLKTISFSFWDRSKIYPDILDNFNYLGVCNCATGCTMIFNNLAKKASIPMPDEAPMHDWWVTINTSKNGIITYIDRPLVLYRQHTSNVVGARNINYSYFAKKIINLKGTLNGHRPLFDFHKVINYGSIFKYYKYKILYTIRRNLK